MTGRSTSTLAILTALSGSLMLAGSAMAQTSQATGRSPTQVLNLMADDGSIQTVSTQAGSPRSGSGQASSAQATPAQDTPARVRARSATSSLNASPADTTLSPRPNALPPLTDAERPRPVRPLVTTEPEAEETPSLAPQARPRPSSAVQAPTSTGTRDAKETPARPQKPSITLAPGATEPEPISMPLGYYVRGDKGCNSVWPGEGDLAWFTPTAFTIDFGGCEPGQFMQTGPNAWSEEQKCHTELGGDAGGYSVTYEVTAPGEVHRRAVLEIDESVEEDVWKHCEAADVPQEARFKD